MSTINVADKEISVKIVYYGPGLSGKTTSLQSIHQMIPATKRPKLVSLATEEDRTLFFDFLPVAVGRIDSYRIRVQLFTVPGQVHYNSTRKLVLKGVDGVVFVADSQPEAAERNSESFENLKENLAEDDIELGDFPHVIQFNKRDIPAAMSPEEMNQSLNEFGCAHYLTTAALGEGIQDALKGVVKLVLEHIKRTQLSAKREAEKAAEAWGVSPPTVQEQETATLAQPSIAASLARSSIGTATPMPPADSQENGSPNGALHNGHSAVEDDEGIGDDEIVPASGVHQRELQAATVAGLSFVDCWTDELLREQTATVERLILSRAFNEAVLAGEELLALVIERYGYTANQEAVFVLLCGISGDRYFRFQEIVAKAKRQEAVSNVEAVYVLHVLMQFALR